MEAGAVQCRHLRAWRVTTDRSRASCGYGFVAKRSKAWRADWCWRWLRPSHRPPNRVPPSPTSLGRADLVLDRMHFLSSRIYHLDLAARNLGGPGPGLGAKVGAFGPSRRPYPMPVQWLAPPVLDGKCLPKSDVWSQGVTLWDLFSLCIKLSWGRVRDFPRFRQRVSSGERLPIPTFVSNEM